ncbi:MAG: arylsulfatase, partial [Opitutae bacterium]
MQVPNDWLDKYAGKYDQGWEKVRSERINKMVKLGLVSDDISTEPLPSALGLWSELSADERKFEARRMEIYAAMI